MNQFQPAFNNIAWKRLLIICAALGCLGTVGESKNFYSGGEAIGYFIGYTGAAVVLAGATTAICSKQKEA